MTGPALEGRNVLVVEKDDARAGRLVMALRALGAKAVRWSDDDKGRTQARAVRADAVLVDAAHADGWAKPALAAIGAEPALSAAAIIQTHEAQLWSGDEPSPSVLTEALAAVAARAERETKSLRAVVGTPAPVEAAKVVVAPSIAARKIASVRKTETYGAVGGSRESSAPPPTNVPIEAIVEAKKPSGYVFPTKKASDLEAESSSKATSLDLTAVPSAILERAGLPDTDRLERVAPRTSWVAWVIGIALVLSVVAVAMAFFGR